MSLTAHLPFRNALHGRVSGRARLFIALIAAAEQSGFPICARTTSDVMMKKAVSFLINKKKLLYSDPHSKIRTGHADVGSTGQIKMEGVRHAENKGGVILPRKE